MLFASPVIGPSLLQDARNDEHNGYLRRRQVVKDLTEHHACIAHITLIVPTAPGHEVTLSQGSHPVLLSRATHPRSIMNKRRHKHSVLIARFRTIVAVVMPTEAPRRRMAHLYPWMQHIIHSTENPPETKATG